MNSNLQNVFALFEPLAFEPFKKDIYEKVWHYFDNINTDLCSLFTSADLEEYLFQARPWDTDDPWVNSGVLCAKFPNGGNRVQVSTVEELLEKFANGHSIVLQQSQKRWKKISDFCSLLSEALNARVGANIYITPPNSQGFDAHYDMHDVLLLQTEGTKIWKVKTNDRVPLTLVDDAFESEFPELEKSDMENMMTVNLSAGQRLYMPRGTIHQGVAYNDLPSVHITFGIKPITWFDILSISTSQSITQLSSELIESVPFSVLEDLNEVSIKKRLGTIAEFLIDENTNSSLMKYLYERKNTIKPSSRFRSINNLAELNENSVITLCQTASVDIISEALISFGGRKYKIPNGYLPVLKAAVNNKVFCLGKLQSNNNVNILDFGHWLIKSGFATFDNREM